MKARQTLLSRVFCYILNYRKRTPVESELLCPLADTESKFNSTVKDLSSNVTDIEELGVYYC